MRDRVTTLNTPEDVRAFLSAHPTSVIFKAGTCHKTMQGFGFLQEQLEPRTDLHVGIIRVVEARPASNFVAEQTGLRHESPQVILYKEGEPVFEVNNWNITPETLGGGFAQLGDATTTATNQQRAARTDLKPYLDVLEQYLSGVMSDEQFEYVYPIMFRDDASLRGREEVEVLNSIFGDVDQHMNMHVMMAGRTKDYSVMRQRAEAAYARLKALEQGQAVAR
jgi:bacillithiol system protein YtxJ